MTTVEFPLAILPAITAIISALSREGISKDRKNQQQGFMFRGVEDVYQALSPLLAEHKVVITPQVLQRVETVREAKSGGALYSVAVEVCYRLRAHDGSCVESVVWGEAMDSGDKATNKALSCAYKYMAFQTFCIPVQGVEDADAETPPSTVASGASKRAAHASSKGPTIEPFETVTDAVGAIRRSTDKPALDKVGHRIAESKFGDEDAEIIRNAWKHKIAEIKGVEV